MTARTSVRVTSPADFPTAACAVLGFVPERSIVVVGVAPTTCGARFDIDDDVSGLADSAARMFRGRITTACVVAFHDATDATTAAVETTRDVLTAAGIDVPFVVVADGANVHGPFGTMPYVLDPEYVPDVLTRDDYATANGLSSGAGLTVGEPPARTNGGAA